MNQHELSCFDRLLEERLELAIQDFQEMDGFDPKRPLLDFYNRSMKLIIICGLAMGSDDASLAVKALQTLENVSRETKEYILKVIPSLRSGAASPTATFLSEI
jgi:hypothetical protein